MIDLYQQRLTTRMKLDDGGYICTYDITHRGAVIGRKQVACYCRDMSLVTPLLPENPFEITYFLGNKEFTTAKEFITAYEAQREAAA